MLLVVTVESISIVKAVLSFFDQSEASISLDKTHITLITAWLEMARLNAHVA